MSSAVILLQRPYISFSSPLLLILRREITAAAVTLFYMILYTPKVMLRQGIISWDKSRGSMEQGLNPQPVPQRRDKLLAKLDNYWVS